MVLLRLRYQLVSRVLFCGFARLNRLREAMRLRSGTHSLLTLRGRVHVVKSLTQLADLRFELVTLVKVASPSAGLLRNDDRSVEQWATVEDFGVKHRTSSLSSNQFLGNQLAICDIRLGSRTLPPGNRLGCWAVLAICDIRLGSRTRNTGSANPGT